VTTQIEVLAAACAMPGPATYGSAAHLHHATIWRWWRKWPTASWCCAMAGNWWNAVRAAARCSAKLRKEDYTKSLLVTEREAHPNPGLMWRARPAKTTARRCAMPVVQFYGQKQVLQRRVVASCGAARRLR
jgi:hypothetical protein